MDNDTEGSADETWVVEVEEQKVTVRLDRRESCAETMRQMRVNGGHRETVEESAEQMSGSVELICTQR